MRVLTRWRHSFPRLQTMALGPSGAPTVSQSKSNSDLRKVCCGCDLTAEQLLHVQLSVQTKIIEADRAKEAAAAARIAAIGTSFNPFDPALSDILAVPPPATQALKIGVLPLRRLWRVCCVVVTVA